MCILSFNDLVFSGRIYADMMIQMFRSRLDPHFSDKPSRYFGSNVYTKYISVSWSTHFVTDLYRLSNGLVSSGQIRPSFGLSTR